MNPPHILLFLTDDHGHWTLPCYGNRIVRAPTLSSLAQRGMVFDRAFTPCPVCSPARASLLTGRMPSAHGIHDWIPEARDDGTFPHLDGMPGNLAQCLREAGYETAYVGKYHCNHARSNPLKFDYWFTDKPPFSYDCSKPRIWYDNGTERLLEGPQGAVVTQAALEYLQSRDRNRPFFLIIGHTNTHTPHTGEDAARVRFYSEKDDLGVQREHFSEAHGQARFLPREGAADRHEQLAQYFAAVETIDMEVGRILDELRSQSALPETCVLYTSDHGHMNGQHGLHTKGNATVPVNFLEESIRVPLIIAGPGITPGARSGAFVDHCDVYATLLDLACSKAGRTTTDGAALPGESCLPLLRGATLAPKAYQVCEYGNARMIRTHRHKLIRRYPGPNGSFPDELYDLPADPGETRNCLSDPHWQGTVKELSRWLNGFFEKYAVASQSGLRLELLARLHSTSCWNIDPLRMAGIPPIYQ